VTIRLLDVAPDKMLKGILPDDVVGGALGLQGVRLYATEPVRSMLDAQLEAINKLTEHYDIRLLIPYLVNRQELDYWSKYINKALTKPVPVGAMVETPAGALDFQNWLDIADFVGIGCNDLMQCLFAADRDRPELRQYLDPYAPLLYRFLKPIAPTTTQQSTKVQICGVLSQLPGVLPVLLGLGYRAFSVDAALVPYLAQTVRSTRITEAEQLAEQVCHARESQQVIELLSL
jgi:phosphoenolpyruvate-protein kinase (PTS system EI component)